MLTGDTRVLTAWAQSLRLPGDKVCFFNFTASHDGCGLRPVSSLLSEKEIQNLVDTVESRGGYVSYRATEEGGKSPYELNASYIDIVSDPSEENHIRAKKMLLTQAVALAMPGVPGIYFHSLVGSVSDREGVHRTGIYRAINREKLNFDILNSTLAESQSLRAMVFQGYQKLLTVRRQEPLFDPYGRFEFPWIDEGIFAILRSSSHIDNLLLALYNFTNKPILCNISNHIQSPFGVELILGEVIKSDQVTIAPYTTMWIKSKKEENENH